MDCDTEYDSGCDGGLMDNAFTYIIENGGIDTEQDYPYTATDGTCQTTKARIPSAITSFVTLKNFVAFPFLQGRCICSL